MKHLHIALCMDPSNPHFLTRCESNPALYTRCSMLWMGSWSQKSMEALASQAMEDMDDELLPPQQRPLTPGTMMYTVIDAQFQMVYNILSFSLASMMATTVFLWMRTPAIVAKYQTALIISGEVTFIAAYHYIRIFNSWVGAYAYDLKHEAPQITGVPFNDAYRYMDWELTVPLLLMEIVLVMKLPDDEATKKCITLGGAAGLMIILGYPGELIVGGMALATRWTYWFLAMIPFCYIVYELMVGMSAATNAEPNDQLRSVVFRAQWWTVVSWLTYPVVYIFPMIGFRGPGAVVAIQCGYCVSDIISKCGVGLIIYQITAAKSAVAAGGGMLPK
jgi:bacteriorhodopsin